MFLLNVLQIAADTANPPSGLSISLDIAAAVGAVLWPLVLFILLFLYRKEIPKLIQALSSRVSKLEFAGIAVELAKAKEFVPDWSASPTAPDLRHKAASIEINDSTAANFLSQLRETGMGDYAVVNLGTGHEWLTTRLYIMSIVFARMKGVKCFVFVETTANTRRRFVCWAEPEKIRWALAHRYQWLEQAYAKAYADILAMQQTFIVSNEGRLGYQFSPQDPNPGIELLREFLKNVQQGPGPQLNHNLQVQDDTEGWTIVDETNLIYEHASWIGGELLEDILRHGAHRSTLNASLLTQDEKGKQVRALLGMHDAFIPVVSENGRFEYLLDQKVLMEQMSTFIPS